MATITLSYDGRSKNDDECPYDPEFVKKIEESRKQVREGKVYSYDDVKKMLNWK